MARRNRHRKQRRRRQRHHADVTPMMTVSSSSPSAIGAVVLTSVVSLLLMSDTSTISSHAFTPVVRISAIPRTSSRSSGGGGGGCEHRDRSSLIALAAEAKKDPPGYSFDGVDAKTAAKRDNVKSTSKSSTRGGAGSGSGSSTGSGSGNPITSAAPNVLRALLAPAAAIGAGRAYLQRREEVQDDIARTEAELRTKRDELERVEKVTGPSLAAGTVALGAALLSAGVGGGPAVVGGGANKGVANPVSSPSSSKPFTSITKTMNVPYVPSTIAEQEAMKTAAVPRVQNNKAEDIASKDAAVAKKGQQERSAVEKAQEERIEAERRAEQKRLEQEEKARAERMEQERIAAERLKAVEEKAKKEIDAAEERARLEKEAADAKERAEKEAADVKARAEREAADRAASEAKAVAEREAAEEKLRIEQEAAEAVASAERDAAGAGTLAERETAKREAEIAEQQAIDAKLKLEEDKIDEQARIEQETLEAKARAEQEALETKARAEREALEAKKRASETEKGRLERIIAERKRATEILPKFTVDGPAPGSVGVPDYVVPGIAVLSAAGGIFGAVSLLSGDKDEDNGDSNRKLDLKKEAGGMDKANDLIDSGTAVVPLRSDANTTAAVNAEEGAVMKADEKPKTAYGAASSTVSSPAVPSRKMNPLDQYSSTSTTASASWSNVPDKKVNPFDKGTNTSSTQRPSRGVAPPETEKKVNPFGALSSPSSAALPVKPDTSSPFKNAVGGSPPVNPFNKVSDSSAPPTSESSKDATKLDESMKKRTEQGAVGTSYLDAFASKPASSTTSTVKAPPSSAGPGIKKVNPFDPFASTAPAPPPATVTSPPAKAAKKSNPFDTFASATASSQPSQPSPPPPVSSVKKPFPASSSSSGLVSSPKVSKSDTELKTGDTTLSSGSSFIDDLDAVIGSRGITDAEKKSSAARAAKLDALGGGSKAIQSYIAEGLDTKSEFNENLPATPADTSLPDATAEGFRVKEEERFVAEEEAQEDKLEAEREIAERRMTTEESWRQRRIDAQREAEEKRMIEERAAADAAAERFRQNEEKRIAEEKKAQEDKVQAERKVAEMLAAKARAKEERLAAEKAEQERLAAEREKLQEEAKERREEKVKRQQVTSPFNAAEYESGTVSPFASLYSPPPSSLTVPTDTEQSPSVPNDTAPNSSSSKTNPFDNFSTASTPPVPSTAKDATAVKKTNGSQFDQFSSMSTQSPPTTEPVDPSRGEAKELSQWNTVTSFFSSKDALTEAEIKTAAEQDASKQEQQRNEARRRYLEAERVATIKDLPKQKALPVQPPRQPPAREQAVPMQPQQLPVQSTVQQQQQQQQQQQIPPPLTPLVQPSVPPVAMQQQQQQAALSSQSAIGLGSNTALVSKWQGVEFAWNIASRHLGTNDRKRLNSPFEPAFDSSFSLQLFLDGQTVAVALRVDKLTSDLVMRNVNIYVYAIDGAERVVAHATDLENEGREVELRMTSNDATDGLSTGLAPFTFRRPGGGDLTEATRQMLFQQAKRDVLRVYASFEVAAIS